MLPKNGKKGKHVNAGKQVERGTRLWHGLVVLLDNIELVFDIGTTLVEGLEVVECRLLGLGKSLNDAHVDNTSHGCRFAGVLILF